MEDVTNPLVASVAECTRAANRVARGDNYEYQATFPEFLKRSRATGLRVLATLNRVWAFAEPRMSTDLTTLDRGAIPDTFGDITDVLDSLLEAADTALDKDRGLLSSSSGGDGSSTGGSKGSKGGAATQARRGANTQRRPQDAFVPAVNNDADVGFVHRVPYKYNALEEMAPEAQLAPAMRSHLGQLGLGPDAGSGAGGVVSGEEHPYAAELATLTYTAEMLGPVQPTLFSPLEETDVVWVDTPSALADMINVLTQVPLVAIDLEAHSYRSFQGFVCLMQVSTRSTDYLVDTLALRSDLHEMNRVTTDPSIVKVLHGADSDIVWLQRDFSVYMVNMFDTGQAARVLSYPSFGLAHLLKFYCSVNTNKSFQLADWRIRPLPKDMIKYARMDTHYLLYIYDRLKNELVARGNSNNNLLAAVFNRSRDICGSLYSKPGFTEDSWRRVYERSSTALDPRRLPVFAALYKWRDGLARSLDESTGYVMPNALLVRLAARSPTSVTELLAVCNPIPPLVRVHATAITEVIVGALGGAGGAGGPRAGPVPMSLGKARASASGKGGGRGSAGRPPRAASGGSNNSQSVDAKATFSEELFRGAGWLEKPVLVARAHEATGASSSDVVPRSDLEVRLAQNSGNVWGNPKGLANITAPRAAKPAWGAADASTPAAPSPAAPVVKSVFQTIATGVSFPKIKPLLNPSVPDDVAVEIIETIPQPQTMSDIYVLSNMNRKQHQERKRMAEDSATDAPAPKKSHPLVDVGTARDPIELMHAMGWPARAAALSLPDEDASSSRKSKGFKSRKYDDNVKSSKGKHNKGGAAYDPYQSNRNKGGGGGGGGGGKKNGGGGRRARRRDQNRSSTHTR